MEQKKYKNMALWLAILWLCLGAIIIGVYFGISFHAAQAQGLHKFELLSRYAIYPVCADVLILIPLLYFIQRFLYKAEMKTMGLIVRILFIHQVVCATILAILYIFM